MIVEKETMNPSLSQGRPANKDMIAMGFKMFAQALLDLKEVLISIIAVCGRVVCEPIEITTFTGPIELHTGVITPRNSAYSLAVGSFFRVNVQGLITEQRTYWDTADWERKIGVDPKLFAPKMERPTNL